FIVQIKDYFDIRYIHFAEIMISNDYGMTWENLKNRFPEHTIIQDALFTPDEEIIAVCNHGKVYYSNDKGNSFHGQQIDTEADLLSISGDSLKYAAIVARDGKIFRPTFPLPTC